MLDKRIKFDERYDSEEYGTTRLYFIAPKEMLKKFIPTNDYPEAISNTLEMASKCNCIIPTGTYHMPYFKTPDNFESDNDYLLYLIDKECGCTQGFFCYHSVIAIGYTPLCFIGFKSCEVHPSMFSWNTNSVALGIFSYSFLHLVVNILSLHEVAVNAVSLGHVTQIV